jgi:predicted metal-binding membrane protein
MAQAAPHPYARERNLILVTLLALAAAAWAVLWWQSSTTGDEMMSLTMGMSAPLFIAVWIVMMVAMMFPTASPMILMFRRVQAGRRARQQSHVGVWLFTGTYLLIWSVAGVAAYGAAVGAGHLADRYMWLMDHAEQIGGSVLVAAGVYQLTPLKRACLSKCRTPMSFIMQSWRDGAAGAVRMGSEHAVYCLGCCWFLFAILFPLGIMNVGIMALITGLIFAEKSLPGGQRIAMLAAAALVVYGAAVTLGMAGLPGMTMA